MARNDPCPCGSGEKYKRCCLKTGGLEKMQKTRQLLIACGIVVGLALLAAAVFSIEVAKYVAVIGAVAIGGYLIFVDPPSSKSGGNPGAINFGN